MKFLHGFKYTYAENPTFCGMSPFFIIIHKSCISTFWWKISKAAEAAYVVAKMSPFLLYSVKAVFSHFAGKSAKLQMQPML